MRAQMSQIERFSSYSDNMKTAPAAQVVFSQHTFVTFAKALMGLEREPRY